MKEIHSNNNETERVEDIVGAIIAIYQIEAYQQRKERSFDKFVAYFRDGTEPPESLCELLRMFDVTGDIYKRAGEIVLAAAESNDPVATMLNLCGLTITASEETGEHETDLCRECKMIRLIVIPDTSPNNQ